MNIRCNIRIVCFIASLMMGICPSLAQGVTVKMRVLDKESHSVIPICYGIYLLDGADSQIIAFRKDVSGQITFTFKERTPFECGFMIDGGRKGKEVRRQDNSTYYEVVPTDEYETKIVKLAIPAGVDSVYEVPDLLMERKNMQPVDVESTAGFTIKMKVIDEKSRQSIPIVYQVYSSDSNMTQLVGRSVDESGQIAFKFKERPSCNGEIMIGGGRRGKKIRRKDGSIYCEVLPTDEYETQIVKFVIPSDADSVYEAPDVLMARKRSKAFSVNVKVEDDATGRGVPVLGHIFLVDETDSLRYYDDVKGIKGEFNIQFKDKPKHECYIMLFGGRSVERNTNGAIYTDVERTNEYEMKEIRFAIPDEAESVYELPLVTMSRRSRLRERKKAETADSLKSLQLDEVTVTATKVMFYNKGDTVVYNADAFLTPEGSTLDALLKQMPGVELRKNGQIYHNGNQIKALLINGKDLFSSKMGVMLNNISAYMVNDVRVYEKSGRSSELLGRDVGDKKWVMDVKLKREYATGGMFKADVGYGTADRYLARLFGMWLSENVSAMAYGGANSLSDGSKLGRDDDAWAADKSSNIPGVETRQNGGVSYLASGYANRWELKGDVDMENVSGDYDTYKSTESFTSGRSVFGYNWMDNKTKDFSVSTYHQLFAKLGKRAHIDVTPKFKYSTGRSDQSNVSGTFREEMKNLSLARLLRVYSDGTGLADSMMNRLIDENATKGHNLDGSFEVSSDIALKKGDNPSLLNVMGKVDYSDRVNDYFSRYVLDYGSKPGAGMSRHRYYKQYPNSDFSTTGGALFKQRISQRWFVFSYRYVYERQKRTSDMYLLGSDFDYEALGGGNSLTCIPPDYDYPAGFDSDQSYRSVLTSRTHTLSAYGQDISFPLGQRYFLSFTSNAAVDFVDRRYDYERRERPEGISRTDVRPDLDLYTSLYDKKGGSAQYTLRLNYRVKGVNMTDFFGLPSTDPLNTLLGNPDLKNSRHYIASFSFDRRARSAQVRNRAYAYFECIDNAAERIYTVNMLTGSRIYRTENVSGNINSYAYYEFFTPFGSRRQFDVSIKPIINYDRNKSRAIGTTNCYGAIGSLNVNWRRNPYRVGVFANMRFSRYDYEKASRDDFSAWIGRCGVDGVAQISGGWSLSSDLSLYTRRGYFDSRLNTSDLVWNARISKSLMKGSLLFVVDGYDLLHQLTNITYSVDSNSRVETVSNVIPAYVLFHVYYRWNRELKRR